MFAKSCFAKIIRKSVYEIFTVNFLTMGGATKSSPPNKILDKNFVVHFTLECALSIVPPIENNADLQHILTLKAL